MGLTRNGINLFQALMGTGRIQYNMPNNEGTTRNADTSTFELSLRYGNTIFISTEAMPETNPHLMSSSSVVAKKRCQVGTIDPLAPDGTPEVTANTITVDNTSGTTDLVLKSYGTCSGYSGSSSVATFPCYIWSRFAFPEPITVPAGQSKDVTIQIDINNLVE